MKFPRRLNLLATRPDRGSLMRFVSFRWAALAITNRRWTAPMSAVALGFGIFAGVAIGPSADGTQGAAGPIMVEVERTPDAAPAPALSPPADDSKPADSAPEPDFTATPSDNAAPVDSAPVPSVDSPSFVSPPYIPPPVTPRPTTSTVDATTESDQATQDGEPVLTTLAGTIVRHNSRAGSYTIADDEGLLTSIHTTQLADVADRIEVEARTLANGTFDEGSKRDVDGRRNHASFSGTVTYRDPVSNAYTVSGVGSSLLVTIGPSAAPPPLGAKVDVVARFVVSPFEAEFETTTKKQRSKAEPAIPGCGPSAGRPDTPELTLRQAAVEVVTQQALDDDVTSAPVQLEGIVQGVCRQARKLILSADDIDESGADITINVPGDIELKEVEAGKSMLATAVITDAGSYRLTALASDDRAKRADDSRLIQTSTADDQ